MKKISLIFTILSVFFVILLLRTNASSQTNHSAEWIRVRSDNGEFSVEVPDNYRFVVDKAGFSVNDSLNNYGLEDVKMFNAYRDKTSIAFESYRADKKALEAIRDNDKRFGKSSVVERGGSRIKQVLIKNDKSYTVRQYLASKNHIYILTAVSRNGETAAMRRFLDSLVFKPANSDKAANDSIEKATLFSALKISQIEIDENPEPYKKPAASPAAPPPVKDENPTPFVIVLKPASSYTVAARQNVETGVVQLRVTFSEDGSVSKIGLLKTLKFGLTREAFFAALRIKFLPAEKDEKPLTVTKIIEYSFSLY